MPAPAHTHEIDGHPVATWIEPIVAHARSKKAPHAWHGVITSGLRTTAQQTALYKRYKDSGFDPRYIAAKPGQSNHEGAVYPKGAIDVSDPQGFANAIRDWHGEHKLLWAVEHGLNDVVHFSGTGR